VRISGACIDYPHYTRPAEFRGMDRSRIVPVNGNHDEILVAGELPDRRWRKTLRNRPDLLESRQPSVRKTGTLLAQIKGKNT